MKKDFSNIFIETIRDISKNGSESQPRDLKVREKFFSNLTINPTMPIAHFRARPFNWKYFAGELAWYLKRDNNVNYINHFIYPYDNLHLNYIFHQWSDRYLKDLVHLQHIEQMLHIHQKQDNMNVSYINSYIHLRIL